MSDPTTDPTGDPAETVDPTEVPEPTEVPDLMDFTAVTWFVNEETDPAERTGEPGEPIIVSGSFRLPDGFGRFAGRLVEGLDRSGRPLGLHLARAPYDSDTVLVTTTKRPLSTREWNAVVKQFGRSIDAYFQMNADGIRLFSHPGDTALCVAELRALAPHHLAIVLSSVGVVADFGRRFKEYVEFELGVGLESTWDTNGVLIDLGADGHLYKAAAVVEAMKVFLPDAFMEFGYEDVFLVFVERMDAFDSAMNRMNEQFGAETDPLLLGLLDAVEAGAPQGVSVQPGFLLTSQPQSRT